MSCDVAEGAPVMPERFRRWTLERRERARLFLLRGAPLLLLRFRLFDLFVII
jgi:hypothetical protein